MSRVQSEALQDTGRDCDVCGDSLAGYFPNCERCDSCTDYHGLEFEAPEPDSLSACLQDIARGLGDSLVFGGDS